MHDVPLQSSLFEEDYLLRKLGQVAHVPQVALTELVANAWDAGALNVDLQLPIEIGGTLTVTDNGHGMTPEQFIKRWMTLRYDRLKHQGSNVEFPPGRVAHQRKAYGRNGVGRHGLLCFGDEYRVETWRDGKLASFVVGTESGPSPFVLRQQEIDVRKGSGTRLAVIVDRHLPDPDEILTVLAARFIHDPEFVIRVNGDSLAFSEIEGKVSETQLNFSNGCSATVVVIDSTRVNHSALHQGVAFWVEHRLVGNPSWAIGQVANFDGRTRFARRYKVIVDTQGFEDEVEQDWTGFKSSDRIRELYQKTSDDHTDPTLIQLKNILLIELKKGGFKITRSEVNQADGYVQDIASSGSISGTPFICAWVVGQTVAAGVASDKEVGDQNRKYGRIRATTFSSLVDTANRRLLRLRDRLAVRYGNIPTDTLLARVFSTPEQTKVPFR